MVFGYGFVYTITGGSTRLAKVVVVLSPSLSFRGKKGVSRHGQGLLFYVILQDAYAL